MTVRNERTIPFDMWPQQPKPRKSRRALYAGAAVVVACAAIGIGVHFATSGGTTSGGGVASGNDGARVPMAGGNHAGALQLNATGQQLAAWNATTSACQENDFPLPDGKVAVGSGGTVTLSTTGKPGSCVAVVSPDKYSSGVIEADIDFPALPGKPDTIANWTGVWLTDQDNWPQAGEIDAVESEPATGKNAAAYHWGTPGSPQEVSTDGFAADGNLPVQGPNLTPGWHVVDVAFTKGFFQVYYDGKLFTTGQADAITGAPENLIISSGVAPDNQEFEQQIGGPPVNSDSSPATMTVKYVKVWSYK